MKLLYAIQGTGNGHLGRAIELAPYLGKEAEIDFLISGKANELEFPFPVKYRYHGLYFIFGDRGGVNYWKSIRAFRPVRFLIDCMKCPVGKYDAIINDFEPVTAWAGRIRNCKVIAVSHQSSFSYENVPRPADRNHIFEYAMKWFAPFTTSTPTHYRKYDDSIFLPLIRQELVAAEPIEGDHIVVYLPAYADDILIQHFNKIPHINWWVFSKKAKTTYQASNVKVFPVNRASYSKALVSAKAVIIGSGFQGTSEALYLGKKIMTIPMWDQYEQLCNAEALKEFGVKVVPRIDVGFRKILEEWIFEPGVSNYSFKPEPALMARRILDLAKP